MKYRYKFLILSIWIVACLVLFHFLYRQTKEAAIADLNQRQMIHATQAVKGIEGYFDHWITLLAATAQKGSIIDLDETGKSQMDLILENHAQGIKGISRVDQEGRLVHTIPFDSKLIGADLSGQKHVQEIIRTHKPVLSGVFTAVQGFRALALQVPVFKAGEYRGTLGINLDFEIISRTFLQDIVIGKTGYAWMVDREGIELYCPVPGHTGNSVFDNCRDFPTILSMAKEMLKGKQGATTYLFDRISDQKSARVRKYAVYLPVHIANTFWSIVVATSEDEVLASLEDFRNELVGVIAVLLLGSILFSYYAMKSWGIVKEEKERKSAEKELGESEERYRNLYDEAPAGYLELDAKGRLTRINKRELEILGCTAEEALGREVWSFSVEEEAARSLIQSKLAGTHPPGMGLERLYRRKDGTTVWVLIDDRLIRDDDGRITGLRSTMQDITERKRTEEALRASEERFKAQYHGNPVPTFTWEKEGEDFLLVDYNLAAVNVSRGRIKDFIGRKASELYRSRPDILDQLQKCFLEKGVIRRETSSEHFIPGGLIMETSAFVPPNMVVGYLEDITERKSAEEALRASEERLKAAFEGSHDAVTITTADGRILECNQKALEMFGLGPEEGFGEKRPADFSPEIQPDGRNSHEAALKHINKARQERFSHFEWFHKRSTGEIFPAEITLTSYPFQGEMVLQATIRDISDRKKAEEEKGKLQAQLLQAQKMESVGRLAGGVAHDFNNMLGIIIGNAEMAALQVDPSHPIHQSLQEILKAGHRSADTVRQLLAFARKQTVSPKVLDLNDTVSGMLKMLRRLIGEDIELAWIPGHDLWSVRIDPSQVNQILANLAVNARDAIAGVGRVAIRTDNTTLDEAYCAERDGFLPGQYVLLAVSDNGTGMSREVLEHLFEPFYTTKDVGKGTGLGLSTLYGIVKQNSGFINVQSEPGQGTTFEIYLPRVNTASPETRVDGEPERLPRGSETVLMVEDESAIVRIGKAMLEELGYTVLTAESPEVAIRIAGEQGAKIRLLLTDVVMPEMNGRDLADQLKGIHPGLKSLFMSGYTADVIAHHGVLDEGVLFIQKPFSMNELAFKVREALDRPAPA